MGYDIAERVKQTAPHLLFMMATFFTMHYDHCTEQQDEGEENIELIKFLFDPFWTISWRFTIRRDTHLCQDCRQSWMVGDTTVVVKRAPVPSTIGCGTCVFGLTFPCTLASHQHSLLKLLMPTIADLRILAMSVVYYFLKFFLTSHYRAMIEPPPKPFSTFITINRSSALLTTAVGCP